MNPVDPKRAVTQITQRLSLRKPQAEALRRLDDITDLIAPSKTTDVEAAKAAVRQAYGNLPDAAFEDFERDFPSVCFALATGVQVRRESGWETISEEPRNEIWRLKPGVVQQFFVERPHTGIQRRIVAFRGT